MHTSAPQVRSLLRADKLPACLQFQHSTRTRPHISCTSHASLYSVSLARAPVCTQVSIRDSAVQPMRAAGRWAGRRPCAPARRLTTSAAQRCTSMTSLWVGGPGPLIRLLCAPGGAPQLRYPFAGWGCASPTASRALPPEDFWTESWSWLWTRTWQASQSRQACAMSDAQPCISLLELHTGWLQSSGMPAITQWIVGTHGLGTCNLAMPSWGLQAGVPA